MSHYFRPSSRYIHFWVTGLLWDVKSHWFSRQSFWLPRKPLISGRPEMAACNVSCSITWLRPVPKFLVRQVWCSYGIGIVWIESREDMFSSFLRLRSMKLFNILLWLLWLVTVISTVSTVSTMPLEHPRLDMAEGSNQSFREVKVGSFFADMNQYPWCGDVRSGMHHALRGRKVSGTAMSCVPCCQISRNCSRYIDVSRVDICWYFVYWMDRSIRMALDFLYTYLRIYIHYHTWYIIILYMYSHIIMRHATQKPLMPRSWSCVSLVL